MFEDIREKLILLIRKLENQPQMGIFTRFWPNLGFKSHKIARYLVLNVSMAHSDAFKTIFNALKVSAVPLDPSGPHTKM